MWQKVAFAVQESLRQKVAYLCQVEQVLQRQALAQVDAMRDVLAQHQRAHQVVDVAGLAWRASHLLSYQSGS